jgi:uncharacterized membrane protein YcaP (DUF421 family)
MVEILFKVDWKELFVPDISITETIVRGSLVYLLLFILLRVVLKRQAGNIGVNDLLVVVLLADAAGNALAAEYKSITNGVVLVATIVSWSYILNFLGYRFRSVQRFRNPPPLPLVKDGKMLHDNMGKELLTQDELMSQLRQEGIHGISEVKAAYMEGDGHISVIPGSSSDK